MWRRHKSEGAEGRKQSHSVIHGYKFNSAGTTRNDLLNQTAATSNLNYFDKYSPRWAAVETEHLSLTQ